MSSSEKSAQWPKAIIHVDMDAFYASVEQLDNPELRGKPVIVGGSPEQRGVVSAASYEARKFGVHSAMPSVTAHRLCPQGIFLPVRMSRYVELSGQIHEILLSFTPLVEPLSIDEAFLDVTGSQALFGAPETIGHSIKDRIRRETGLVASVGVAPNKFLAKIASDIRKPDGFMVVREEEKIAFLAALPVRRIWGVGKVTEKALERLGIRTIGELQTYPAGELVKRYGAQGESLHELALGIDKSEVVGDREAKSISSENTYAQDIEDLPTLRANLLEMTCDVARRLREQRLIGRTVHLKIRYADFKTITRSETLGEPSDSSDLLWEAARGLFEKWARSAQAVRLLGFGVSGLRKAGTVQGLLFEQKQIEKLRRVDKAADRIRERFGDGALRRGWSKPESEENGED